MRNATFRLRGNEVFGVAFGLVMISMILLPGCPGTSPLTDGSGVYNNTADPTNNSAKYLGSEACRACHPVVAANNEIHGHAHKLTAIQGSAPVFPEQGTRAGVPNPPAGFTWEDVAYVIGGYIRKARFIDHEGYILTNDADGVDPQWNLTFGANGVTTGFVPYENTGKFGPSDPKPYNYSCFQCHTTGAQAQDGTDPQFQENRPGFAGTWEEAGVQCEECHGPGSNHVANPAARDIYVNSAASACGQCHIRGPDPTVILASGGFIRHHEQWPELLSSGGHAGFNCTTCHDPHISVNYDRANAIRNECIDCHSDQNMALHQGRVFARGDYVEFLECQSCHMPYATKSAAAATTAVAGKKGRIGDMRTHIFRISTDSVDYKAMFSGDGSSVVQDDQGRAAVTVDFVCLRCHNDVGSAFSLTISSASEIALRMHGEP